VSAKPDTYHFEIISSSQFDNSRDAWQALLDNSPADSLFTSWFWAHTWWELYGSGRKDRLCVIFAKNTTGTLVGIAPLYRTQSKGPAGISLHSLQFLGTRYRTSAGYRCECMEFIVHNDHPSVALALTQFIQSNIKTNLIYLSDLIIDSETYRAVAQTFGTGEIDGPHHTYSVSTQGEFSNYISGMGKNTRLKAFNRRKLLEEELDGEIRRCWFRDIALVFDTLNQYHSERWNASVSSNKHRQFILQLTKNTGIEFDGGIIQAKGRNVAATLDLVAGRRRYNIQLAFDAAFHKKLSLGLLALTYCTEQCFMDNVDHYDFLTGTGKNTDYKAHIANQERSFCSLAIPLSSWLKVVFAAKAAARKVKAIVSDNS